MIFGDMSTALDASSVDGAHGWEKRYVYNRVLFLMQGTPILLYFITLFEKVVLITTYIIIILIILMDSKSLQKNVVLKGRSDSSVHSPPAKDAIDRGSLINQQTKQSKFPNIKNPPDPDRSKNKTTTYQRIPLKNPP